MVLRHAKVGVRNTNRGTSEYDTGNPDACIIPTLAVRLLLKGSGKVA